MRQVKGDRRAVAGLRLNAAQDGTAAAEGDDGDVAVGGPGQQGDDLGLVGGVDDGVGGIGDVTGADADQVAVGLAVGVLDTREFVGAHHLLAHQFT
jgi:hypothetical protein